MKVDRWMMQVRATKRFVGMVYRSRVTGTMYPSDLYLFTGKNKGRYILVACHN